MRRSPRGSPRARSWRLPSWPHGARCSRPRWATSWQATGSPPSSHAGASALHRSLFDDTRREAQLILPGAGGELRAALASRSASAARAIPEGDPSLMQIGGGRLETALRDAAPIGARLASLAPLSLIAAALLLGAAALRAPTRRRGLRRARARDRRGRGCHRRGDRDRPRDRPLDFRHQPRRRRGRHDLERVPRRPAPVGAGDRGGRADRGRRLRTRGAGSGAPGAAADALADRLTGAPRPRRRPGAAGGDAAVDARGSARSRARHGRRCARLHGRRRGRADSPPLDKHCDRRPHRPRSSGRCSRCSPARRAKW